MPGLRVKTCAEELLFGNMKNRQVNKFEKQMEQILEPEDQVCLIPISDKAVSEIKTWGEEVDLQAEIAPDMICFI